jgi:hypothetical protein
MSISLQKFGSVEAVVGGGGHGQAKPLGSTPPDHKVQIPSDLKMMQVAFVDRHVFRRAAELALPSHQQHWGRSRFQGGTLEAEKKNCIEICEHGDREMKQVLENIWRGSTWPDSGEIAKRLWALSYHDQPSDTPAGCKSNFAKTACQLIVEQMYMILASTDPGTDGECVFAALSILLISELAPCRSESQRSAVSG